MAPGAGGSVKTWSQTRPLNLTREEKRISSHEIQTKSGTAWTVDSVLEGGFGYIIDQRETLKYTETEQLSDFALSTQCSGFPRGFCCYRGL